MIMKFIVPEDLDGITVKTFLRRHHNVSARLLAKLKRIENGMTVSGRTVRSVDILKAGDEIFLSMPEDTILIEPQKLDIEVVYEDNDVIVFNKPPHMTIHPVGKIQAGTLANAAAEYALSKGESYTFRAVNRLDKDTSGLVLAAKNSFSASFLKGKAEKVYIALCHGKITGTGTIDKPLRIKEGHSIQRETGEGGKKAVTHYEAIKNFDEEYTLLRIRLETGRTHQIRAHFSCEGHPLAGDDMYGGSREHFPRQCLHCAEISFVHPVTGETVMLKRDIDFFDEYR